MCLDLKIAVTFTYWIQYLVKMVLDLGEVQFMCKHKYILPLHVIIISCYTINQQHRKLNIYNYHRHKGNNNLNVVHSTFRNNDASFLGGAIYA
jgi:hypothetical protein